MTLLNREKELFCQLSSFLDHFKQLWLQSLQMVCGYKFWRLRSQMKVKTRSFSYAQMHFRVAQYGKTSWIFFSSQLAVKYFSDKLEHVGILVSDVHPVWQLLTATRAEIYFHRKFTIVAYYINFKSSRAEVNSIFFSKVFDYIFIFWAHVTNPRCCQRISKVDPFLT